MSADLAVVLVDLAGGGTQRVVSRLIRSWAAAGHRVLLIAPPAVDGRWDTLPAGVEHVWLDVTIEPHTMTRGRLLLRQAFAVARMALRTRRAVRDSGAPTVVSFLTGSNLMTIVACAGLGRRVVLSERNDTTRQQFSEPVRLARRLLYRRASVVTANSTVGLRGMADYVPEGKLVFTPNGVVLPDRRAQPVTARTVVSVGRLEPHKQHRLLIDAFARLHARDLEDIADWRLRIAGDGSLRVELRRAVERHGLGDRIDLAGHVGDVDAVYRAASVFVLPSSFEGTPNALLEAMAHGLACVVSDSLPGALELVEDGTSCVVFRDADEDDLADALESVLTDARGRERLGAAARIAAESYEVASVERVWDRVLWPDPSP